MGTSTWTANYKGHRITVRNHIQWFPPKTWESVDVDDKPAVRHDGSLFRAAATLFAQLGTGAAPALLEVRIAQVVGSTRAGCHILVDGELVGGDTDKKLRFADPREWETVRKRGLLAFLAVRGVLAMGVPFGVMMVLANRTATLSARILIFVIDALFFGLAMGYVFWRTAEAQYKRDQEAREAARSDTSRAA